MNLVLLTPTGDRPEAFALCERWIGRQTYKDYRWVVIDDGAIPARCTMGQNHLHRPDLRPLPAKIAHAHSAGLFKGAEAVAIIEDDDWYAPDYLARTVDELELHGAWAAGETRTLYYHVGTRQWMENDNTGHASLCQTVIGWPAFGLLAEACNDSGPFIDCRLWPLIPHSRRRLFEPTAPRTLVGIKGMPGRPGYGSGHSPDTRWHWDPNMRKLRELIGADADAYVGYAKG